MTRFALAQKSDLPALSALWQTCFGDDPSQIQAFWRTLWDERRVFAAYEGSLPVSMLCALPAELVDEAGESAPAAYLYAVCTAPQHRGRGLCSALMSYAESSLRADGCCFVALVPAGERLFRFYEKRGYQTAFFHRSYTVAAAPGKAKITRISPETYHALREMQLYGAFLSYDFSLLQWQAQLGKISGAGLYRVETNEAVCCIAAERMGAHLFCKELLPDCPEAAACLAAFLGCKDVSVRTQGGALPFGMLKALQDAPAPQEAYLGFAFD